MKLKDWSDWKVTCSAISEIMSRPKGAVPLSEKEKAKVAKITEKEEQSESDIEYLAKMKAKDERFLNPELSSTAIKHLVRRYSWEKYNKRVVSIDQARSTAKKGTMLEEEAIKIVASLDKQKYVKEDCVVNNDYLIGVCDVFHNGSRKIIDVKASWNIYTFMPNLLTPVSKSYWFQMQGYMELYNADVAEVCYVLVNTPPHLIALEHSKLNDRYMLGEITREKYEEGLEGLAHAFDYNKIPLKRRVIRQEISRYNDIVPLIYRNVIKCREWLNEFEKIHTTNKKIIIPPDNYVKHQKEDDNSEPDTSDPR